jgi:membrane-associated phospholipid phosphatase
VRALERATTTIALGFFICYLFFVVFPVAGPRYLFPPLSGPPARSEIYAAVHAILDRGSSKGTAFPSSHVAASVSSLLAAWRESRSAGAILLLPVSALVVGTVYGRFHYGVDALAGLLVAAAAFAATPWLVARLGARA